MPSFVSAALAALSLSSIASASVAYRRQELNFNNSSSASSLVPSTGSRVPIGTGSSSIITPTANGTISSPSSTATAPATTLLIDGVSFRLEIDVTYSGIIIELDILAKRAGQTLEQCLSTCAASSSCAGTAFDSNSETCTFYRSIDLGSRRSAPGITFATVQGRATNSSTSATSTRTNNGTSVTATPNNPTGNGTFFDSETLICPLYNDEVLLNTDGSQFLIECGTNAQGTVIGVRKARMIRRQATFGNEWLIDCIDTCTALGNCVATAYNSQEGTCTFYSAIEATFADAATDLAIIVAQGTGATTTPATAPGADVTSTITTVPLTTSTVFSTTTRTISSCAPDVTNCPLRTVTEVVPAYTTVCPVSTAGAFTTQTVKVCTACQYVPATVTVYQCPTLGSTPGNPVPVTTKVVSVPVLNGPTVPLTTSTVYSTSVGVTTSCGPNGCPKVTVTNVVSLYTTVCPVSSTGASVPGTTVVPGTTKPESTIPATTIPGTTGPETTVPGSTKPATTVPGTTVPATTVKPSSSIATVSNRPSTTSSMVMYTGAAVKNAGMGFAAAVAGAAAFLL